MSKKRIQTILEEHVTDLDGLNVAFVGNRDDGMAIASVNPGDIDVAALAAYATELIRANMRLAKILGRGSATSYIVSSTTTDKLLLQVVPDTNTYIAILTDQEIGYRDSLPRLKAVLAEGKEVLPKLREPS